MIGAQGYYEFLANPPAALSLNAAPSMDIAAAFSARD